MRRPGDGLLAAIPVCFAIQQAAEGGLWLLLPSGPSAAADALAYVYLALAWLVWPVLAPAAAMAAETAPGRRRAMTPALVVGAGVAAWLAAGLLAEPRHAQLVCDHISYGAASRSLGALTLGSAYLFAVSSALTLSSDRWVAFTGWTVAAGSVVAYVFYFEAFPSVWCYFAAVASLALAGRFILANPGLAAAEPLRRA